MENPKPIKAKDIKKYIDFDIQIIEEIGEERVIIYCDLCTDEHIEVELNDVYLEMAEQSGDLIDILPRVVTSELAPHFLTSDHFGESCNADCFDVYCTDKTSFIRQYLIKLLK
jgi:hypothetical protein